MIHKKQILKEQNKDTQVKIINKYQNCGELPILLIQLSETHFQHCFEHIRYRLPRINTIGLLSCKYLWFYLVL